VTSILNDGSDRPPRLRLDMNLATLWNLPAWSKGPAGGSAKSQYRALRAAGFEGVQSILPIDAAEARDADLHVVGLARVMTIAELETVVGDHCAVGFQGSTLLAGTGLEGDDEASAWAEAIVGLSARYAYPLFLETHRGSVTQDVRRTVELVDRFPALRFTGDLSHWYTGHEFGQGDTRAKLDFIEPVLRRVRLIHGRLSHAGAIQVSPVGRRDEPFVGHFQKMWRRCFEGFLAEAGPGDVIVFAPELLPAEVELGATRFQLNYAHQALDAQGAWREESDRWTDALELCALARDCFALAAGA